MNEQLAKYEFIVTEDMFVNLAMLGLDFNEGDTIHLLQVKKAYLDRVLTAHPGNYISEAELTDLERAYNVLTFTYLLGTPDIDCVRPEYNW